MRKPWEGKRYVKGLGLKCRPQSAGFGCLPAVRDLHPPFRLNWSLGLSLVSITRKKQTPTFHCPGAACHHIKRKKIEWHHGSLHSRMKDKVYIEKLCFFSWPDIMVRFLETREITRPINDNDDGDVAPAPLLHHHHYHHRHRRCHHPVLLSTSSI